MKSGGNKFLIVKADEVDLDVRTQMSETFADGFTQWLIFFSKDKNVIAKAFAHMFILDQFYVAMANGEIAGVTACTDGKNRSVRLNKKELRKHLGFFKGSMAGIFLKKEFEAPYENFPPNTGSVEFVGTASKFRGQGVASQIIQHIIENTPYNDYVIEEVADTNTPAMRLYKKLGFEEYKRKPIAKKIAKKIGINNFLSLKYVKR
ncbi:N-acetyltransferase [Psychrobacillus sp. OK032]|uniref:GNAT family N-acetyltransferase n=1 Tax=Psychrobacillus sp. OK032 TaxID=1884358 RepID=UPI0008AD223D|nr:N-acetyltransferase [Psychrobacillus sp. OK032]SES46317.1 Acetyltransferase (GNAT) family protein [Psychrobacillus sp. OK032]